MAACIRNNTRMQLALSEYIVRMKSFDLKPVLGLPTVLNLFIASFYGQKRMVLEKFTEGCSAMLDGKLNGPKPGVYYGAIAANSPKLTAMSEDVDKALFEATPLVFMTIIDERPDAQNHMSHLTITKAERAELVKAINTYFEKMLDSKEQNYTVSSASVL